MSYSKIAYSGLSKDGKVELGSQDYSDEIKSSALVSIAMSLKRIADTLEKSATKSSDAVTTAGSEIHGMFHVPLGGGRI